MKRLNLYFRVKSNRLNKSLYELKAYAAFSTSLYNNISDLDLHKYLKFIYVISAMLSF